MSGIGLAFNSDVSVNDVVALRFQVKTSKLKFFEEEHAVTRVTVMCIQLYTPL